MPRQVNLDPVEIADALRWMPMYSATTQQVAELMDVSATTVRQKIPELSASRPLNAGRVKGSYIIWLNKPKVNGFMETLPDFEYVPENGSPKTNFEEPE